MPMVLSSPFCVRAYFKYLTAAFGSALISSIYGVVDMAMVGQYQGPRWNGGLGSGKPCVEHYI